MITKKKECAGCKIPKNIFSRGYCKTCWTKLNADKLQLKRTPIKKGNPKVAKKRVVTIPKLKKDARYWFQRWIRLRDINTTCAYGCGSELTDIRYYDAAHYLKAELYPEAIFDEHNVHGSCKGCNIRDDQPRYRKSLILRKGLPFIERLESKYVIDRISNFKWDREFLTNIISTYRERCKELEVSK